jgi:hypothetical protein
MPDESGGSGDKDRTASRSQATAGRLGAVTELETRVRIGGGEARTEVQYNFADPEPRIIKEPDGFV